MRTDQTRRAVLLHVTEGTDTLGRPSRKTYGLWANENEASNAARELGARSWSFSYVHIVNAHDGIIPAPVTVTCPDHPEMEPAQFASYEEYDNSELARLDCAESHIVTEGN